MPSGRPAPVAERPRTRSSTSASGSDPIYELGCRLGLVHSNEDVFWKGTFTNLAASFGVNGQAVSLQTTLVDPKMQWSQAGNVWQNAAIRTGWYTVTTPVRWARGPVMRGQ